MCRHLRNYNDYAGCQNEKKEKEWNICFYKITEIVRVIWLVKNLWFIIPVNP